jgi:prepilin peptidase CpaA
MDSAESLMNSMKMTYVAALIVGFGACITDIRSRRVPNVLTFGSAIVAVLFHILDRQAGGFIHSVEGLFVGAAIFFVPFALGGLGGGDVKLLAALGAWVGPADAAWIALYAGVAGGVLALAVAVFTGYLRQALANIWLLFSHWRAAGIRPLNEISLEGSAGPRLAYAIPIFTGLLVNVWLRS